MWKCGVDKTTRAVWKVRGLTLLLGVGTLWRCGEGLIFELPPLARDAFLTTPHPLPENVLQTVEHFEISCLGAPLFMVGKVQKSHGARSELNSVFGLEKVDRWNPIRTSGIQSRSRPWDFWAFTTMKMELRGKKFRIYQRSAARFREVGGAL
jgi:hypothetical protein